MSAAAGPGARSSRIAATEHPVACELRPRPPLAPPWCSQADSGEALRPWPCRRRREDPRCGWPSRADHCPRPEPKRSSRSRQRRSRQHARCPTRLFLDAQRLSIRPFGSSKAKEEYCKHEDRNEPRADEILNSEEILEKRRHRDHRGEAKQTALNQSHSVSRHDRDAVSECRG